VCVCLWRPLGPAGLGGEGGPEAGAAASLTTIRGAWLSAVAAAGASACSHVGARARARARARVCVRVSWSVC